MANITTGILGRSSEKAGMTAGAKQCGQDFIRSMPKRRLAAGKPLLRPVKSRWVTESVQPLKSTTVAPQTEKMICWLIRIIPVTDKTHAVCCNKVSVIVEIFEALAARAVCILLPDTSVLRPTSAICFEISLLSLSLNNLCNSPSTKTLWDF